MNLFILLISIPQGMALASIRGVNVMMDSREGLVIVRGTTRRVCVPGTREVVPCAPVRGSVCVECVSVTIMEQTLDSTAKNVW